MERRKRISGQSEVILGNFNLCRIEEIAWCELHT